MIRLVDYSTSDDEVCGGGEAESRREEKHSQSQASGSATISTSSNLSISSSSTSNRKPLMVALGVAFLLLLGCTVCSPFPWPALLLHSTTTSSKARRVTLGAGKSKTPPPAPPPPIPTASSTRIHHIQQLVRALRDPKRKRLAVEEFLRLEHEDYQAMNLIQIKTLIAATIALHSEPLVKNILWKIRAVGELSPSLWFLTLHLACQHKALPIVQYLFQEVMKMKKKEEDGNGNGNGIGELVEAIQEKVFGDEVQCTAMTYENVLQACCRLPDNQYLVKFCTLSLSTETWKAPFEVILRCLHICAYDDDLTTSLEIVRLLLKSKPQEKIEDGYSIILSTFLSTIRTKVWMNMTYEKARSLLYQMDKIVVEPILVRRLDESNARLTSLILRYLSLRDAESCYQYLLLLHDYNTLGSGSGSSSQGSGSGGGKGNHHKTKGGGGGGGGRVVVLDTAAIMEVTHYLTLNPAYKEERDVFEKILKAQGAYPLGYHRLGMSKKMWITSDMTAGGGGGGGGLTVGSNAAAAAMMATGGVEEEDSEEACWQASAAIIRRPQCNLASTVARVKYKHKMKVSGTGTGTGVGTGSGDEGYGDEGFEDDFKGEEDY
eukprot:scaffold867_cov176-Ochromonas_danica.AAC.2